MYLFLSKSRLVFNVGRNVFFLYIADQAIYTSRPMVFNRLKIIIDLVRFIYCIYLFTFICLFDVVFTIYFITPAFRPAKQARVRQISPKAV